MTKANVLRYLSEHKKEFEQRFGITKLGLFGSYARDEEKENSDIDILVELRQDLTNINEKKFELRDIIEKEFGKKVDIAREKYLKPFVKDEILKEVTFV